MIRAPTTWTVNQCALVDVVLHRRALRLPCVIREVGYPLGGTRILVELVDVLTSPVLGGAGGGAC